MRPVPHPNAPLPARAAAMRRPLPAPAEVNVSESLHTMESWLAGLLIGGLAWAGLLSLRPVDSLLGVVLMLGVAAAVVEWRGDAPGDASGI